MFIPKTDSPLFSPARAGRALLLAVLTLSVLGSQQLVAMKRPGQDELEGREAKRQCNQEPDIQMNDQQMNGQEVEVQGNTVPSKDEFLTALTLHDVKLVHQIISQKPEYLRSGPLKYLTQDDAEGLVRWSQDYASGHWMICQLVDAELETTLDLKKVERVLIDATINICDYNSTVIKLFCIDSRLSSFAIQSILSWTCERSGREEVLQILLNDLNVNPDTLAKALDRQHVQNPLCIASQSGNINAVMLLLNSEHVMANTVNYALRQFVSGRFMKKDMVVFQVLLNDYRITPKGVNDALEECVDTDIDILKELLQNPRITADSVNKALKNRAHTSDPFGFPGIEKLLLADHRMKPETIDQTLLELILSRTFASYMPSEIQNYGCSFLKLLLTDNRVTPKGINIALVRAATERNQVCFDMLRADPRVQTPEGLGASPFPLDDLMNPVNQDACEHLVTWLEHGLNPLFCVSKQSNASVNHVRDMAYNRELADAIALSHLSPE